MTPTTAFFLGMFVAAIGLWLFRVTRQHYRDQRWMRALHVLESHGLSAQLYLPTVGADPQLHDALEAISMSGYVVLDQTNNVVGCIVPRAVRDPRLFLAVSND